MLDAIAGEDDPALVVEPDGDGEHDGPLRVAQPLGDSFGDVRVGHRLLELRDGRAEERRVPFELGMGRRFLDLSHRRSVFSRGFRSTDAGGGSRTLMARGPPDFKSGASDRFRHPGGVRPV